MIPWPLAQPAGADQSQGLLQLSGHHFDIQLLPDFPIPMHLAIETVEVAVLIGVHVSPDRQSTRARRDDRIHETVIQKVAWRTESGLGGVGLVRTVIIPNQVPLLNRVT